MGLTRAQKTGENLFRHQPAHARPVADQHPLAFFRRAAGSRCRGHRVQRRLRRLWRLRVLALRRHDRVRLQLHDARLAARAGEESGERPQRFVRGRGALRVDEDLSDLSPLGEGRSGEARSGERPRRPASGAGGGGAKTRRLPLTIEGELIAKSTGTVSAFTLGDRVFHQKFGNGNVTAIDGNKLTIQFDKAGEKRVVDSFVERV